MRTNSLMLWDGCSFKDTDIARHRAHKLIRRVPVLANSLLISLFSGNSREMSEPKAAGSEAKKTGTLAITVEGVDHCNSRQRGETAKQLTHEPRTA